MNMQSIMAQAQRMQKEITQKKEELNSREFVGENGIVHITMNGNKEMLKIIIDNENLDKEDFEVLEDMILLAYKNALEKINKETEKVMGAYGSLNGLI